VPRSCEGVALAVHFHDRLGITMQNIDAALNCGIRIFEGALAGLGGCPFVPDAPGNVDLQSVDAYLREHGYRTGLDPIALRAAAAVIREALAAAHPLTPAAQR
jgi:hydroxymethylglutaryl-CoA lyase